jgi:hypothetical protein
MALSGIEIGMGYANTPLASYDPTKWNYGTLWRKRTDIAGGAFFGPLLPQTFRPKETSAAIEGYLPRVVQWSATLDWMFLADQAATAATRRFQLYLVDRTGINVPAFTGFITVTFPTATNYTIQDWAVSYEKYSVGTASVSGTTVTGTSTLWQTNRQCAGCRIGFGSTDPTQITTWYQISSIGGEGTITLATSAGTLGDGAYVIEDLRFLVALRNATTTNGGFVVIKGLQYADFTGAGTAVGAAVSTDNVKASFWLADAASVTNITAIGLARMDKTDWQNQVVYIADSAATTNITIYKYNSRAALTLTSGKDTTSLLFKTGQQTGLTGNTAIVSNLEYASTVAGHTAGNGVPSLYFVTVSRWYRVAITNIVASSTSFVSDVGTEVPPGGVSLYAATGAMAFCQYSSYLDAFLIQTSAATAFRSYITKYRHDGSRFDKIFMIDDKQLDQQVILNEGAAIHATTNSVLQTSGFFGGLLYMAGTGTTAITNIGRIFPIGADAFFQIGSLTAGGTISATAQVLISPKITLSAGQAISTVSCIEADQVGHLTTEALGIHTEALYQFYRTSGITDNSGSWTPVPQNGVIVGVSGPTDIQFAILGRTVGLSCVPPRLYQITVTVSDFISHPYFSISVDKCDKTLKRFGWLQNTSFGGTTMPVMRAMAFDGDNGNTLFDDNSGTGATGSWARSVDGINWGSIGTMDKVGSRTYFMYIPASMSDNVNARFKIGTL